MKRALAVREGHLAAKTFLVGEGITAADVVVFCSLLNAFKLVFDGPFLKPFPAIVRWFSTCKEQVEFVDVLGGPEAPLFTETFVELCTAALRAIREHSDTLLALTEVTMLAPALPCFAGQGRAPIEQLRQRLLLHVPDDELRERVRQLVLSAYDHSGYYLYDRFQKASNGIEF